MTKIAMIGTGSVVFVKKLLADILAQDVLSEATVALHDIDPERLETAGMMARYTARHFGANPRIEEHLDRRATLEGDRESLYRAAVLDRLAPAVMTLSQIHAMVDELIDRHASVLPDGIASRRVVAAAG